MLKSLVLYQVKTPMHMGTGTEIGRVDMPIQREYVTNFPKIESSGIKGVLRVAMNKKNGKGVVDTVFGPEEDGSEYSSCIKISDAKLLLFPVKTVKGIFAWITCPFVLERFKEDCQIWEFEELEKETISFEENVYLNDESNIIISNSNKGKSVIIEDYAYKLKEMEDKQKKYIKKIIDCIDGNKEKLEKDIVVLSNEDFKFFVTMSTEINTRIRIGDNGIVDKGGLFTEEYLPSESILYNFIEITEPRFDKSTEKNIVEEKKKAVRVLSTAFEKLETIQLGGNETLGKGITSIYKIKEINKDAL